MSAKEKGDARINALSRRIDDLTSALEDATAQHTVLKRRFDQLRDDYADQLASLRGRITAKERWEKPNKGEELQPASVSDIVKGLSAEDRRILRALLAGGDQAQPSPFTNTQGG